MEHQDTIKTMATDMPMERFDKHKDVLSLLDISKRKFKNCPSKTYSEEVACFLTLRLSIKEVIAYLDNLHLRYENFPFMTDLERDIREIEQKRQPKRISPSASSTYYKPWRSSQAPDTPAKAEALFNLIKTGRSNTLAFRIARNMSWAKQYSDEEIWEMYNAWVDGKVHPKLVSKEEEELFS